MPTLQKLSTTVQSHKNAQHDNSDVTNLKKNH